MRAELDALLHELKHLRREGCETVYLADNTLDQLRNAVALHRERFPAQASESASASRSSSAETASADELVAVMKESGVPPVSQTKGPASKTKGPAKLPPPPKVSLEQGSKQVRWEALRTQVLNDKVCLSQIKPGKQPVFGVGNVDAEIFFCGEAPGAEEEMKGEPFVGPAGQLLTKIIEAMGLSREKVYIANIMNWRPPMPTDFGNRPPTQEEMGYCLPYLRAQVEVVQPKLIVALGKTAVDGLLGPDPKRRMGQIRGTWHRFEGIPLLPTFHPSYLLRNNNNQTKRQVWEDMLQVMEQLGMPVTERQRRFFT